jgi:hypothetical protein
MKQIEQQALLQQQQLAQQQQQLAHQQMMEQKTLQQRFEQQASSFQQQFSFNQQPQQPVQQNQFMQQQQIQFQTAQTFAPTQQPQFKAPTPTKSGFVARKMPDFKSLHSKSFSQMKNIDQVHQDHVNRAESLRTTTTRTSLYQRKVNTPAPEENFVVTKPTTSLGARKPLSSTTTTSRIPTSATITTNRPPRPSRPIGYTTPNKTATTTTTTNRTSLRSRISSLNKSATKNDFPVTVLTPKSKPRFSTAVFELEKTPEFNMGSSKKTTTSRIPLYRGATTPGATRTTLKDTTNDLSNKSAVKKYDFLKSSRSRQATRLGAHRNNMEY